MFILYKLRVLANSDYVKSGLTSHVNVVIEITFYQRLLFNKLTPFVKTIHFAIYYEISAKTFECL